MSLKRLPSRRPSRRCWPLLVAAGLSAGAPRPAAAVELAAGLEAGGVVTEAQNPALAADGRSPHAAGAALGGLLLEQRFGHEAIALVLWEDLQSPLTLQVGPGAASYLPLAFGLRAGLRLAPFELFLGPLFQVSVLLSAPAGAKPLVGSIVASGGDLGLDFLALPRLRLGVELRVAEVLGGIASAPDVGGGYSPEAALELQGLVAARWTL